jgi:glyoxylase-like metal-dependent hydrolase (beta-lactamase superfamily II)
MTQMESKTNSSSSPKILITSLDGNRQYLDGGAMFGNVPRALWSQWTPPDEQGRILLACRVLLVQIGPFNILLEGGIGAALAPKLAERFGIVPPDENLLPKLLRAPPLNLAPEDIHFVILSHLHFDHAGGILRSFSELKGETSDLLFPNAYYLIGKNALARAQHPHQRDRASFIPGLVEKLMDTKRLVVLEGSAWPELALPNNSLLKPHFEFMETAGHTPGQMHTLLRGPEQSVFFCGDLIPGKNWVHLPVTMGYDRCPESLVDEKEAMYQRAQEQAHASRQKKPWIFFFTHDPKIAAATVTKDSRGNYAAAEEFPSFSAFPL